MTYHFDLTKEAWIPALQKDGELLELSLYDVLCRAHELREISGESPMVVTALYRLLLAVLYRVNPEPMPETDWTRSWTRLWRQGQWETEKIQRYLKKYQEQFDLFAEHRPFYQAKDDRVKAKSVSAMMHEAASGNNATLFDHTLDTIAPSLTPAQAARYLLAAQAFGLAGLSGLPDKFTYAPCVGGVLFLVEGDSLFHTLMLNFIRYPDKQMFLTYEGDAPCWEQDDPFAKRTSPKGYLDYLTWPNRRILLLPEMTAEGVRVRQMTVAPGLRMESSDRDPMMCYWSDAAKKREMMPLRLSESRALWRDSIALFRLHLDDYNPPRAFGWVNDLAEEGVLETEQTYRFLALGMANDQAKMEFFRTERMPLPLAYLRRPELVGNLERMLKLAEDVSRQLWGASNTLARYLLIPEKADDPKTKPPEVAKLVESWAVERGYWAQLETSFQRMLRDLPDAPEKAKQVWFTTLRERAKDALELVIDNLDDSVRCLRAAVQARGRLFGGLAALLKD